MNLSKNYFRALLAIYICVSPIYGMDTEQSEPVEQVQSVVVTNKSRQRVVVWQRVNWDYIHEQQPQPVQQKTASITHFLYQAIVLFMVPSAPKNQEKWVSTPTGGIEMGVVTLSPEQSHNFNVMLCKKLGEGHFRKRTEAFIRIRKPEQSEREWGPIICACPLNADQNASYVITENAQQELMICQQE